MSKQEEVKMATDEQFKKVTDLIVDIEKLYNIALCPKDSSRIKKAKSAEDLAKAIKSMQEVAKQCSKVCSENITEVRSVKITEQQKNKFQKLVIKSDLKKQLLNQDYLGTILEFSILSYKNILEESIEFVINKIKAEYPKEDLSQFIDEDDVFQDIILKQFKELNNILAEELDAVAIEDIDKKLSDFSAKYTDLLTNFNKKIEDLKKYLVGEKKVISEDQIKDLELNPDFNINCQSEKKKKADLINTAIKLKISTEVILREYQEKLKKHKDRLKQDSQKENLKLEENIKHSKQEPKAKKNKKKKQEQEQEQVQVQVQEQEKPKPTENKPKKEKNGFFSKIGDGVTNFFSAKKDVEPEQKTEQQETEQPEIPLVKTESPNVEEKPDVNQQQVNAEKQPEEVQTPVVVETHANTQKKKEEKTLDPRIQAIMDLNNKYSVIDSYESFASFDFEAIQKLIVGNKGKEEKTFGEVKDGKIVINVNLELQSAYNLQIRYIIQKYNAAIELKNAIDKLNQYLQALANSDNSQYENISKMLVDLNDKVNFNNNQQKQYYIDNKAILIGLPGLEKFDIKSIQGLIDFLDANKENFSKFKIEEAPKPIVKPDYKDVQDLIYGLSKNIFDQASKDKKSRDAAGIIAAIEASGIDNKDTLKNVISGFLSQDKIANWKSKTPESVQKFVYASIIVSGLLLLASAAKFASNPLFFMQIGQKYAKLAKPAAATTNFLGLFLKKLPVAIAVTIALEALFIYGIRSASKSAAKKDQENMDLCRESVKSSFLANVSSSVNNISAGK